MAHPAVVQGTQGQGASTNRCAAQGQHATAKRIEKALIAVAPRPANRPRGGMVYPALSSGALG